ncbi:MAG TPA: CRISPR-associated helicase Cas3' [Gammaproteobacteria bacterium]|nr:CRISPR-associated helicase Cas3' [Gammaproteobacteria bacterium]
MDGPEATDKDYLRYWAKTARSDDEAPCHLLPWHNLDVAAVGHVLLETERNRAIRLARSLDVPVDTLISFCTFSLALHDIGKFARAFQGLARPEGVDLVEPDPRMSYTPDFRHDALGAHFWQRCAWGELTDTIGIDLPSDPMDRHDLKAGVNLWLGPFFGHHGRPVESRRHSLDAWFKPEDRVAASHFLADTHGLLAPKWPLERLCDSEWQRTRLAPATWELAGLAVVCDWLGSDQMYFTLIDAVMPLEHYWREYALPRAHASVARSGLMERPTVVPFPGFAEAFALAPSPLQVWAESAELPDGPGLFLLEDVTGSGKTEAALTLAQRLMAAGRARGLYFGLPTMATSNAMYARLGSHYRRLFAADAHPSFVLAHGARHLHEDFTASLMPTQIEDRAYMHDEASASIACNAWIGDSRKKALLADVGVGTIDQALLGILPRRHQSLRLLGLSDKVLIVDEVHAYDAYTGTLLERLLESHARQGGSAILLSATVPGTTRNDLLRAWHRGRDTDAPTPGCTAFPLVTQTSDSGLRETPLAATARSRRSIEVTFLEDESQAHAQVLAAAAAGQCVCWIRNTVDEAIAAYQALQAQAPSPGDVLLFHARFAMGDRQRIEDEALRRFGKPSGPTERAGRILVATQVVEQSLDLDFDALVSDIAPIDLLIQRAGRLRRHPRTTEGTLLTDPDAADNRGEPVLHVLAPPWREEPDRDWVKRSLPGTSYVYRDAGNLWLTFQALRHEGGIHLPERARALLEAVYGPDTTVPDGLDDARGTSYAEERVRESVAGFTALDLAAGYTTASANGGWDGDQESGTRLSDEPSVAVVLVRLDADGAIQPWLDSTSQPWAMSTINLRESTAARLPGLPAEYAEPIERLREQHRSLTYARFWAPGADANASMHYDGEFGAVKSTTKATQ